MNNVGFKSDLSFSNANGMDNVNDIDFELLSQYLLDEEKYCNTDQQGQMQSNLVAVSDEDGF
jgi:hypothetical protein